MRSGSARTSRRRRGTSRWRSPNGYCGYSPQTTAQSQTSPSGRSVNSAGRRCKQCPLPCRRTSSMSSFPATMCGRQRRRRGCSSEWMTASKSKLPFSPFPVTSGWQSSDSRSSAGSCPLQRLASWRWLPDRTLAFHRKNKRPALWNSVSVSRPAGTIMKRDDARLRRWPECSSPNAWSSRPHCLLAVISVQTQHVSKGNGLPSANVGR